MNKISLSICCPCYNNELTIHETLESVSKLYENNKSFFSDFEFVIFNNYSTDMSDVIISKNIKPYIKYYKSEKHYNGAESLKKSILKTQNEYIWIIGDDVIIEDSQENAIRHIEKYNPDICILSSILYDRKNNVISERSYLNRLDYFPNTESLLNSLTASVNHFFVGNIIFRKSLKALIINAESMWPHIEMIISYFESGHEKISCIQSRPTILETTSGWHSCHNYCRKLRSKTLLDLLEIYKKPTKSKYADKVKYQSLVLFKNILKYNNTKVLTAKLLYLLYLENKCLAFEVLCYLMKHNPKRLVGK